MKAFFPKLFLICLALALIGTKFWLASLYLLYLCATKEIK